MKPYALLALSLLVAHSAFAVEFTIDRNLSKEKQTALRSALDLAMEKLPQKLKDGLPSKVSISIKSFAGSEKIPTDICDAHPDTKKKVKFTFGEYQEHLKTLSLNKAVVDELVAGRQKSKKISCQHGSAYDQALATIIHELTHAYDFNHVNLSKSADFLNAANFSKSLFGAKRKNVDPMRSPDLYEFKNSAEALAVNMEYFTLDPEFACRKPVMFHFLKKAFGADPYPNRNCEVNSTFMLTTQLGFLPHHVPLDRIYRIDYLLAEKGSDIVSGFGHSMFRIIVCAPERTDATTGKIIPATPYGEKCLEDRLYHLVVSFRANAQDAKLNYFKGFFGGYASMLFILNFADVLDEYNREELRDVISYPLSLSEEEKQEFIYRVLEEHWSYKGSYKFVTNNCAVESQGLVENFVEIRNDHSKGRLTPYGLLKELINAKLVQEKDPKIETFNSNSGFLVEAYNLAYHYKAKNENKGRKALVKFLKESTADGRMKSFKKIYDEEPASLSSKEDLIQMKSLLVKAASFSVIEQQAVRIRAGILKKKLGEYADKMKGKKLPEDQERLLHGSENRLNIEALSNDGYGVPLSSEIVSMDEIQKHFNENDELLYNSMSILEELFPDDIKEMDQIAANLKIMNSQATNIRKQYKVALDNYVVQSIVKLIQEGSPLISHEDTAALRKVLGESLVTQKEMTDLKLISLIHDHL